ncbi:hypothetical protein GCM10020331_080100 [Ectobacillus funiculus]
MVEKYKSFNPAGVRKKELLHSRAELKALQAQIDPHFLYNTLNALYWSLEDKGEEELADQVIAMSEFFFRYTIGETGKEKGSGNNSRGS